MSRRFASLIRFFRSFSPAEIAWKGAAVALYLLAGLFAFGLILDFGLIDFSWGRLGGVGAMLIFALLMGLGGRLAWLLLSALAKPYRGAVLLLSPLLYFALMPAAGKKGTILLGLALALGSSLVGGTLALLRQRGRGRLRQWRVATALALGVLLLIFVPLTIFWPRWFGLNEERNVLLLEAQRRDETLSLENPGAPGAFSFTSSTYGSGEDRHRVEYGEQVDVRSRSVDGSRLVEGWEGMAGDWRSRYWGFDATALPLQGRVWLPEGDGPFPLVLLVHGNHGMEDFSDVGYAYLGELLASRGSIFVSVDENFLNSSIADFLGGPDGGLDEENDLRGWLLLEHVRQWQDWSTEAGHPWAGKADLDRVILMGHSRGGEAVASAAVLHRLGRYPDDARVELSYDFDLRGIAAIAPVDGQYRPRKRRNPLLDTDYFVIHGSLDGDVQSFMGTSVYERARFTGPHADGDPHFKASLYVVGANHGQFNTSWGSCDGPRIWCWGLDTPALMDGDAQRQVAQVYLSAFVETTAHERDAYREMFRHPRFAAAWLPSSPLIANYGQTGGISLADFEEDLDPETATLEGARIETRHLTRWKELWPELKWNDLDTHLALIAWDSRARGSAPSTVEDSEPDTPSQAASSQDAASYSLELAEPLVVGDGAALVFALARSSGSTLPSDWEEEEEQREEEEDGEEGDGEEGDGEEEDGEEGDGEEEALDWTVEVVDAAGVAARLPLSHDHALYPPINSQPRRLRLLNETAGEEIILRHFSFDLADFTGAEPAFDPTALSAVRFLFDRSEKGAILLDDLALIPTSPAQTTLRGIAPINTTHPQSAAEGTVEDLPTPR